MFLEMYDRHLITIFMILLFSIVLWPRKRFKNTDNSYFWITVISCFLLVIEDITEVWVSGYPSLRLLRILISVLGYNFRSVAAVGLLFVIVRPEKRKFVLWIPCLVNLLVCCTAFFTDIAFGYDENYAFYRGPLGYVAFAVPALYLMMILWITFKRFSEKNNVRRGILPICAVFCAIAALGDVLYGGTHLNEAIIISCVIFYIVLYSFDSRRDALTGLLNRQAFYDDCISFDKRIGAVISIDMNGLKELNDTKGHQAGDAALAKIGECLRNAADQNAMTYRMGGDEFLMLFLSEDEKSVINTIERIRKSVSEHGYSVSAGYSLQRGHDSLTETIKESDVRMYEDKSNYYRSAGKDRRKR